MLISFGALNLGPSCVIYQSEETPMTLFFIFPVGSKMHYVTCRIREISNVVFEISLRK